MCRRFDDVFEESMRQAKEPARVMSREMADAINNIATGRDEWLKKFADKKEKES